VAPGKSKIVNAPWSSRKLRDTLLLSTKRPPMTPRLLMARPRVIIDPGGSKFVKIPWCSRYPWRTPEESM
jgi:hypothetical protein